MQCGAASSSKDVIHLGDDAWTRTATERQDAGARIPTTFDASQHPHQFAMYPTHIQNTTRDSVRRSGERSTWLGAGDHVGVLGDVPVVCAEFFGVFEHRDTALRCARESSRTRGGAPTVILERCMPGGSETFAVITGRLDGPPPLLPHALRSRVPRSNTRVSDIVFGEVAMAIAPMPSPNPWLFLLE